MVDFLALLTFVLLIVSIVMTIKKNSKKKMLWLSTALAFLGFAIIAPPVETAEPKPTVTKSAEPKPSVPKTKEPEKVKPLQYNVPTESEWVKIKRMPDSIAGKDFTIYGCVTQFDNMTGSAAFRANVDRKPVYEWYDGENAVLTGDETELLKIDENQRFSAKVILWGSLEYKTTIGGEMSVPQFLITEIKKTGSC
jgi:hypothetical protein